MESAKRRFPVSDYDYELPKELIACRPAPRGSSRLLILDRKSGSIQDAVFSELPDILKYPLTVCRNKTAVVKTRIFAKKSTGGEVEILVLNPYEKGNVFEALIQKGGRLHQGDVLSVGGRYRVRINGREENVFFIEAIEGSMGRMLEDEGHVPLPPYIEREDDADDIGDYQTVFAGEKGSSAAPTAGLHFSEEILQKISEKGARFADIVLHVGLGTFAPVKSEFIDEHKIHREHFIAGKDACAVLNESRSSGRPVLAVGTTALRVLETIYDRGGKSYAETEGETDIFIYPPYVVEGADMLLTNFHLPKSTLLMLVSAFAGRENIMNAYRHAIAERYRFFSYGDAMLIR